MRIEDSLAVRQVDYEQYLRDRSKSALELGELMLAQGGEFQVRLITNRDETAPDYASDFVVTLDQIRPAIKGLIHPREVSDRFNATLTPVESDRATGQVIPDQKRLTDKARIIVRAGGIWTAHYEEGGYFLSTYDHLDEILALAESRAKRQRRPSPV